MSGGVASRRGRSRAPGVAVQEVSPLAEIPHQPAGPCLHGVRARIGGRDGARRHAGQDIGIGVAVVVVVVVLPGYPPGAEGLRVGGRPRPREAYAPLRPAGKEGAGITVTVGQVPSHDSPRPGSAAAFQRHLRPDIHLRMAAVDGTVTGIAHQPAYGGAAGA